MNFNQLELTLQGAILNLANNESVNREKISKMADLMEREWIEEKLIAYLELQEKLRGLNPQLNSVELEELVQKQFLLEIEEEMRAVL
jgi:hypothetical protein